MQLEKPEKENDRAEGVQSEKDQPECRVEGSDCTFFQNIPRPRPKRGSART